MAFEIEIDGPRMIATQTGTLDWQDCDRAFALCESTLNEHSEVTQLLLDLRQARLALRAREAGNLAELATLTFSRPVKTAIVCPTDAAATRFLEKYVYALEKRGALARSFLSLEQARSYLAPQQGGRQNQRSILSQLKRVLFGLSGRRRKSRLRT